MTGTRVAITGMACRLPGAITTPQQFWAALAQGRDLITDPAPDHPRAPVLPAGILRPDDLTVDAAHFGLTADEVAAMDPQQQVLLETAEEALQDAGIAPSSLRGSLTGVWVGSSCPDQVILRMGSYGTTMVDTAGALPSMLANRLSWAFDLRGGAEVVNAACSASLVALHRARRALAAGEVDLAIVAGVNWLGMDAHTRMFETSGVIAPGGRCRPFDAAAEGFVRGEGAGVVVLESAEHAAKRGARVRAVVAASALSSDGRSPGGLARPGRDGQIAVLRRAYAESGRDPAAVGYVQAHGTATREGDAVEASALGAVLGRHRPDSDRLVVGSVKATLGHLEGAAGIVSLIAVVLAAEHGQIPPTPHHTHPLPALSRFGLEVATRLRPWPEREGVRVAGVSAFGLGGTNAHVIIEHTPAPDPDPVTGAEDGDRAVAVPISAPDGALAATAARWAAALTDPPACTAGLAAVAATAVHRRDHLPERAVVVATGTGELAAALEAAAAGRAHPALIGPRTAERRPTVVFVYAGHGAHSPGMGARLTTMEPVFAAAAGSARAALDRHRRTPAPEDALDLTVAHPALVAHQIALTALLAAWGVVPDVVLGHSLGEVAAAHTAGALTLDDTARVAAERSALLAQAADEGGMLATDLPADRAAGIARTSQVTLAAVNGPAFAVFSGGHDDLAALRARLDAAGIWAKEVPGAPPAHSPVLNRHAHRLTERLDGLAPRDTTTPVLWSPGTATPVAGSELGARYWGLQLRAPVQLHAAMQAIDTSLGQAGDHDLLVIEIGAHPVLAPSLAATLTQRPAHGEPSVLACGDPATDEHTALLRTLAHTYTRGLIPHFPTPAMRPVVALPPHAWSRPGPRPAPIDTAAVLVQAVERHDHDAVIAAVRVLLDTALPQQRGAHIPDDGDLTDAGLDSLSLMGLRSRLQLLHPELKTLTAAELTGDRGAPTLTTIAAAVTARLTRTET
ncbi:acyl transferase domain-containing protein [Murinocardiopsis flavida]|uniref:Acyl transferase domain-containing protein n=1 Tax=Murinocardiopsis flavida TaxID=645275 RepID=A0A2P8CY74_9ACTN|nr:type I polyketide synthase [Murinocardiopsis flavida]PSK89915.1 acyl transferase domain-containing protein [Murinocardiopsis flavida]